MNFGIVAGFLLIMILIGIIKRGKTPDIVNYYVSGRSKSVFAVSGSIVSTAIGGSATVGLAGIAFAKGLPAVWWLLSGSIALVILAFLWAGKIREYEVYTLPEVLEKQYNSSAIKIISSIVIVTAWTGVTAAQMIAAGKIINVIWPGHYQIFIILCAFVFIFYTVIGGQNAVISTDLFQGLLIFFGITTAVIFAYINCGPLSAELLPQGHLNFPVNTALGYTDVLMYFMFVGTSFLAGPDMYSRILSSKDKNSARKSVIIAALLIAFFAMLIVAAGLYSRIISPGIDPESSLQALIINTTPPAFHGIVFAALLAAFLSSADTCLLTSGVILTNDILSPVVFRNKLTDRNKLIVTKSMVVLCGVFSLIIALYVNGIIKSLFLALTVYTSGIIIPVVLGFYREKLKINQYGAISGIITGGTAAIIMKSFELNQYLVYIFPAVFVIIILISMITRE